MANRRLYDRRGGGVAGGRTPVMRALSFRWRRGRRRSIARGVVIAATAGIALAMLLGWKLETVAWAQDAEGSSAVARTATLVPSTVAKPGAVPDTAPPSGLVKVPEVTPVSSDTAASPTATPAPSSASAATPSPEKAGAPAATPGATRTASLKAPQQRTASSAKDSKPAGGTPFGEFSGNHGPVSITSDQLSLDYKKNTAVFSGHARVVQAGGVLTCDKLTVKYTQDTHEIQEAIADGNVRMSQGTRWAASDHAVLNQANHTVVLTGNPVVHDGNDQVAGKKITFELQTGNSIVDGAAKAVFFPRTSKSADNQTTTNDSQTTNGDQTSADPAQ